MVLFSLIVQYKESTMTSPIDTNSLDDKHFNQLTPAQLERLAILAEECGEVVHIIGKIMRHGLDSCHPSTMLSNREALTKEMGDVRYAMIALCKAGDIVKDDVHMYADAKTEKIQQYLHHQEYAGYPRKGQIGNE